MRTRQDPGSLAARRRKRMVKTMAAAGTLVDRRWTAAFAAVPRHTFLPRFFRPQPTGRWGAVDDTDEDWLDRVYADRVLVTQLDGDPGRWAVARRDGSATGVPTSSSSQPTIMAVMLSALAVEDGHRVLEIGTGTGYNAALLCHRLGSRLVTTVDVDADLIAQAAENLDQCGYRPTVAVCDGAEGYPPRAPYDRVLATCSVSRIPLAWLEQTVPGGLVVTTLNRPIGAGLVRITAGQGAYGQGWVLPDDGRFMPLRAHRRAAADELLPGMDTSTGQSRGTPLGAGELIAPGSQFEFYAGLSLPDVNVLGDDDGSVWLVHPDGSWARQTTRHGHRTVIQGGPRPLWDIAEAAHARWISLGRPRRERFGITVEPDRQRLWLDDPDSPRRWNL